MKKPAQGFSLIELVIAVSLASFVLVGVATIAAQMARSQLDGIRSGTVSGWAAASYMAMAKEIEEGNVLAYPIANGAAADSLIICKNWSRSMVTMPSAGRLDTSAAVAVIQYCLDTSGTDAVLRRYANVGFGVTCPAVASPVACVAAPAGTWTENGVVGFRVEKIGGANLFLRDNGIGGVRLSYVIGNQVATTNQPVVKFTQFNFGIAMQKQFSSPVD